MKHLFQRLNKSFDSRVRLALMSLLMVREAIDFNELKDTLELTDGNLASHLKALEQKNYITVTKQFVGRKTMTTYTATQAGRSAFEEHLNALEAIIRNDKENS